MNTLTKIMTSCLVATGIAGGTVALAATDSAAETPLSSNLTIEQVSELALAAQPGTIEEIELEKEDGKSVFDVEIVTAEGQEMEVLIDAASGEILAMKADDDDRGGDRDDDDHDDDRN